MTSVIGRMLDCSGGSSDSVSFTQLTPILSRSGVALNPHTPAAGRRACPPTGHPDYLILWDLVGEVPVVRYLGSDFLGALGEHH